MMTSLCQYNLSQGIWSVFISLVSAPLSPNRLVTAPLSLPSLSWAMLILVASLSMLAFWWLVLAVSLLQAPTLVQMLRSTEICLTLVTQAWVNILPSDAILTSPGKRFNYKKNAKFKMNFVQKT